MPAGTPSPRTTTSGLEVMMDPTSPPARADRVGSRRLAFEDEEDQPSNSVLMPVAAASSSRAMDRTPQNSVLSNIDDRIHSRLEELKRVKTSSLGSDTKSLSERVSQMQTRGLTPDTGGERNEHIQHILRSLSSTKATEGSALQTPSHLPSGVKARLRFSGGEVPSTGGKSVASTPGFQGEEERKRHQQTDAMRLLVREKTEVEINLNRVKDELRARDSEVEALRAQVSQEKHRCEDLTSRLQAKDQEAAEGKFFAEQVSKLTITNQELSTRVDEKTAELRQAHSQCHQLEESLAAVQREQQVLERRLEEAEKGRVTAEDARKEVERVRVMEQADAEEQCRELEEQLRNQADQFRVEKDQMESTIRRQEVTAQDELRRLQEEKQLVEEKLRTYVEDADVHQKEVEERRAKEADLVNEIAMLKESLVSQEELERLEGEKQLLEEQLQSYMEGARVNQEQAEEGLAKQEELVKQIALLQESLVSMEHAKQQMEEMLEDEKVRHLQAMDGKWEELEAVLGDLEGMREQQRAMEAEVVMLRNQVDDKEAHLIEVKEATARAEAMLQEHQTQMERLVQDLEFERSEKGRVEAEMRSYLEQAEERMTVAQPNPELAQSVQREMDQSVQREMEELLRIEKVNHEAAMEAAQEKLEYMQSALNALQAREKELMGEVEALRQKQPESEMWTKTGGDADNDARAAEVQELNATVAQLQATIAGLEGSVGDLDSRNHQLEMELEASRRSVSSSESSEMMDARDELEISQSECKRLEEELVRRRGREGELSNEVGFLQSRIEDLMRENQGLRMGSPPVGAHGGGVEYNGLLAELAEVRHELHQSREECRSKAESLKRFETQFKVFCLTELKKKANLLFQRWALRHQVDNLRQELAALATRTPSPDAISAPLDPHPAPPTHPTPEVAHQHQEEVEGVQTAPAKAEESEGRATMQAVARRELELTALLHSQASKLRRRPSWGFLLSWVFVASMIWAIGGFIFGIKSTNSYRYCAVDSYKTTF